MHQLTKKQGRVVRDIAAGKSEGDICRRWGWHPLTLTSHKKALRAKGIISYGVPGKKGSVKVLVAPWDYEIVGELYILRSWVTPTIIAVARAALAEGRLSDASVVADALEDAGCTSMDLVAALRTVRPVSVPVDVALPAIPMPKRGHPDWDHLSTTDPEFQTRLYDSFRRAQAREEYTDPAVAWDEQRMRLLERLSG